MDASTSDWNGRKVLVTGCTGFLGGAVTRELLSRGAIVVGLVREPSRAAEYVRFIASGQFTIVHGRVEDQARLHATMAVHEVRSVFDFAPSDRGTSAVARAAALQNVRVPVVSARPSFHLRVTGNVDLLTGPIGVARFEEVFGPGDRNLSRTVPKLSLATLRGEPVSTPTGSPRDFVFIRDAVSACLTLAEAIQSENRSLDFTFRSGWELTESQIADGFAGRGLHPKVDAPFNPLGWRPETSLTEALAETIAWYRARPRVDALGIRRAA